MADNLLLAIPALIGVVISLSVAFDARRRQPGPAWSWVAALSVSVAWWCAFQVLWITVDRSSFRIHAAQLQYLGITTTPVLWLLVGLAHTRRRAWLSGWRLRLLFAVPAITLALVFTNDAHHLVWQRFVPITGGYTAELTYGPWFYIHTAYSYSSVAVGTLLLVVRFASSRHYRASLLVVLLAPTFVAAANLGQITARSRLPIDPTPASLALAVAAMAWSIRRYRLFALLPLARSVTVDSLTEGVVVVDAERRVVDANPASRRLLGRASDPIGLPLDSLIGDRLPPSPGTPFELDTEAGRRIEVRVSPVRAADGVLEGEVVLLGDVTEERATRDRLLRAQEELQALNTELERLASTDALTGLANRRRLLEALEQEWTRCRRYGRPLALCMIDLDHFKEVNDRRGHRIGDRVLEAVGPALSSMLRAADLAVRYGGEELVVMLPETDTRAAIASPSAYGSVSAGSGIATKKVLLSRSPPASASLRSPPPTRPSPSSSRLPTPRSTGPRRPGVTASMPTRSTRHQDPPRRPPISDVQSVRRFSGEAALFAKPSGMVPKK